MRLNISKLNLGSDSAERDIDVGLTDYFYQNDTYHRFLDGRKTILVGNRGAGKSAIFKYIAATETKKGHLVLELSPEDYSYELLADYLRREHDGFWRKQSAYSVAWQYLLYNLIFEKIASKKRGLLLGSTKNIFNYVDAQRGQRRSASSIAILFEYLKRVERVKLGGHTADGSRSQALQDLYGLEEIRQLIPSLKAVLKNTKIKILIDELDKGWDNSEDARYFIAGLFQATQKLNVIHDNLRIYISIRQELFDNIPQIYEDAQKIREDVEVIRWGKTELLELIGRRIAHSFLELRHLDAPQCWNAVFVSKLKSCGVHSLDYIVDRTQLRPRELLQFCKLCVERVDYSAIAQRIDAGAIAAAEEAYSEQKTRDLASEYRFQYPHLLDVFEIFRGHSSHYTKEELDDFLLEIVCGEYDSEGASFWVLDMDYLELKRILWKIGFLKAWAPKSKSVHHQLHAPGTYLGHYERPTINLENIEKFQIHPAFTQFLHLRA